MNVKKSSEKEQKRQRQLKKRRIGIERSKKGKIKRDELLR